MTDAEKAAADAAKAEADAKARGDQPKTYSEEHVKELINERDKAKEKARLLEDERQKAIDEAKKAAESKAIAEGKLPELLEAQKKELAARDAKLAEFAKIEENAKKLDEQQKKLREQALNKISDPKLKEIASKLPDVADVLEFVDTVSTEKTKVFSDKAKNPRHEGLPDFKSMDEVMEYAREKNLV